MTIDVVRDEEGYLRLELWWSRRGQFTLCFCPGRIYYAGLFGKRSIHGSIP